MIRASRYDHAPGAPTAVDIQAAGATIDAETGLVWIDCDRPDQAQLASIMDQLAINEFAQEDVAKAGQRTKLAHCSDHFHMEVYLAARCTRAECGPVRSKSSSVRDGCSRSARPPTTGILGSSRSSTFVGPSSSSWRDAEFALASNRRSLVQRRIAAGGAIFLVATLVTGVLGMNFQDALELSSRQGFFMITGVILVLCAPMCVFFRRRKWL